MYYDRGKANKDGSKGYTCRKSDFMHQLQY